MKVIGSMIKLRDKVFIPTWMVPNIKESGKKISSMEKERKPGLMELCTKEIIF
jgi:hypothetical protein